jgi:hypothetical protein
MHALTHSSASAEVRRPQVQPGHAAHAMHVPAESSGIDSFSSPAARPLCWQNWLPEQSAAVLHSAPAGDAGGDGGDELVASRGPQSAQSGPSWQQKKEELQS